MTTKAPIGRRAFLISTAAPVAGVAILGITRVDELQAAELRQDYKPSFFTVDEWRFVNAAVDRLIPADDTGPGAIEAGVPEFIDRQMETPYGHGATAYMQGPFQPRLPATLGYQLPHTPRDLLRRGIANASKTCQARQGMPFTMLSAPLQDAFLHLLESGGAGDAYPPHTAFFAQLLENTREGYFADPMYGGNRGMAAWKAIGFPGARADFTDWIDQPGKPYPFGPVSIAGERA